jgi:hypothetical protein
LLRGAAAAPWKSDEEINEKQRIQGSLSGCKNVPYKLRKSDFFVEKSIPFHILLTKIIFHSVVHLQEKNKVSKRDLT